MGSLTRSLRDQIEEHGSEKALKESLKSEAKTMDCKMQIVIEPNGDYKSDFGYPLTMKACMLINVLEKQVEVLEAGIQNKLHKMNVKPDADDLHEIIESFTVADLFKE